MDEDELVKRIEKAWVEFQKYMDAFALYADLVKSDMSGFKEMDPANVQIKESMIQYLRGYPHAVELKTLCDLYEGQYAPIGLPERIAAGKELAINYASVAEKMITGLISMAIKEK